MDKNQGYWTLHKELWQEESDKLDSAIQKKIMNDPLCDEARHFNCRLDILIKEKIDD